MALRLVSTDRVRRIAFSPKGGTVVIVNQLGETDIYIFTSEEEGLNVNPATNLDANNNLTQGTKVAANGGQLNYVDYPGQLYAIASGFATPAGGGAAVAGSTQTNVRVLPG